MKLKAGIIAGAIVALASSGAVAQVGVQVGIQGGGSIVTTELSTPGLGGGASVDGIGSRSARPDFGGRIGADYHFTGTPIVLGVFGEWNSQDIEFNVNPGGLFKATLGDQYGVGGRVGVLVGPAMPYILVGYSHVDASYTSSAISLAKSGLPGSFNGLEYGGGIEMPIKGTPLTLALETRWIKYQAQTIGTGSLTGLELQPEQLQAMVRLNWNFGGPSEVSRSAPLK